MFKFTLLGIEVGKDKSKCLKEKSYSEKSENMGKSKQQKKFGKAVSKCHSKTKSPKQFGSCMRKELKR